MILDYPGAGFPLSKGMSSKKNWGDFSFFWGAW